MDMKYLHPHRAFCSLPCLQGRAGVGLHGLAANVWTSPHPNPPLLHVGEGAVCGENG
jgi:hypothetical protein